MKKISRKIACGVIIFITLIHGFFCDDLSDECVDLLWGMRNCSMKLHLPKNCKDARQSELFTCAESVAQKLPQCTDDVARKMINHYVTTYKQSDSIICEQNLHAELKKTRWCFMVTQPLVVGIAQLTPGFITTKGCKFFKSLSLIAALGHSTKCFKVAKDYVDAMYSKSICSKVDIDIPVRKDFHDLLDVLMNTRMCWMRHRNFSTCDSDKKSRRLQCVEDETLNRLNNTQMQYLEENILMIAKKTEEVLCASEQLKQDFESNPKCLRYYIFSLHLFLVTEINGFFTEEGCEGVKYREKYRFAMYGNQCRRILHDYWTEMKKVLPCVVGKTPVPSSRGEKISGIVEFTIVITLVTSFRNIL